MKKYNKYAKIKLTPDDFPDDPKILQEGILQLRDLLREEYARSEPTTKVVIPGIRLSSQQEIIFRFVAAHGEITRGHKFPNMSNDVKNTVLYKLRSDLYSFGVKIPFGKPVDEESLRIIRSFIHENETVQRTIESHPPSSPANDLFFGELPDDRDRLRDLAHAHINCMRGNPEEITLSSIRTASVKILLSTLLAKTDGKVSKRYVYAALYTPFTEDARADTVIDVFLFKLRRNLAPLDIAITLHNEKIDISAESRARLLSHMQPAALAPRV